MELSRPLLPQDLIQRVEGNPMYQGFSSSVYTENAHTFRLGICNWKSTNHPDSHITDANGAHGFTDGARRTQLHVSAIKGDILYTHELLRYGATPDGKDAVGLTPTYIALIEAAKLKQSNATHFLGQQLTAAQKEKRWWRLLEVVKILIEQHIDVNQSVEDISLLQLACSAKAWDIISLLLQHGAQNVMSRQAFRSCLGSKTDRDRFSRLIDVVSLRDGHERPGQKCPCWSGKVVDECHGIPDARIFYPANYLCPCGTGKVYRRCCTRKNPFVERWDRVTLRITQKYDHLASWPEDMHGGLTRMLSMAEQVRERKDTMPPSPFDKHPEIKTMSADHWKLLSKKMAKIYLENGLIDPAFAYAMSRTTAPPQPQGRQASRLICEEFQSEWNRLVDEYIAGGTDPRSTFEIERAAKIGLWGGALIRVCEGVGCGKVEVKDVAKLRLCAKCQISVYCSTDCQKSAWPTHKGVCSTKGQVEQALPSSTAVKNVSDQMANVFIKDFKDLNSLHTAIPAFLRSTGLTGIE